MKILKKITGLVLALSTCAGIVSNTNALALTYHRGDVDGDNITDTSDLAYMAQFLNGYLAIDGNAAERMDVYKDYVINKYDKSILSSIVLGNIPVTSVTSTNTDNVPDQNRRRYKRFDPVTGQQLGYYDIYDTNILGVPGVSTYSINPPDDRHVENGFDGIINVQDSNNNNKGTAFVVDAHTLLTAAHVVYTQTNYQFKIFSNSNTESDIQITPVEYHIPSIYISSNGNWKYDYAIVTVQEDLSNYINFDLGIMRNEMPENRDIYVTGFGGNGLSVSQNLVGVKSTGVGHLVNIHKTNSRYDNNYWDYAIFYNTDTAGGNSGSPVYVRNPDGTNTVIAIHTYGDDPNTDIFDNSGTRITTDILKFVYNNPYL